MGEPAVRHIAPGVSGKDLAPGADKKPTKASAKAARGYKCGVCGKAGHSARTCSKAPVTKAKATKPAAPKAKVTDEPTKFPITINMSGEQIVFCARLGLAKLLKAVTGEDRNDSAAR